MSRPPARHATAPPRPAWPWVVPLCLLPVAIIALIVVLNLADAAH